MHADSFEISRRNLIGECGQGAVRPNEAPQATSMPAEVDGSQSVDVVKGAHAWRIVSMQRPLRCRGFARARRVPAAQHQGDCGQRRYRLEA